MLFNNQAYWLFYQRKNDKNNEFKQRLNLQEGVNFVSFYIVFNDIENINYLLNENNFVVNDSIERISDGTTTIYKGNKDGWVGPLQNFDNTNVFKFKLSKSVDITFFGNNFVQLPMKITYKKGITSIPCPYSNTVNLNNLSFSHLNDESYIYYSDPTLSSAHWSSSIDSWIGDLSYIEPGRGYMLNTTYDGELIFPFLEQEPEP